MKPVLIGNLSAMAIALLIAGCGGGGDSAPTAQAPQQPTQPTQPTLQATQLRGTAAVGAPVAAGDVSVTCGAAGAVATTTAADGTWSVNLSSPSYPCVVAVSGGSMAAGTQLVGYAMSASDVNVTPLTTLIGAYATNAAKGGALTKALLDAGTAQATQALSDGGFSAIPSNPLGGAFTPAKGDAHDDLIADLMLSLNQQGSTLNKVAGEIAQDGTPGSAELITPNVTAFDSVQAPFPGNMPSYGPEAYSLTSLGDRITLAADTPRKLRRVTVGMSSWACESGSWGNAANCVSAPNASFSHPVTLRIYDDKSGQLLATKTQAFAIPYRPSSDVSCTGGRWKGADGACYNGFAFKIVFDLRSLKVTLPDDVRYEVSYNTRSYGTQPLGVTGPYDSLNIGIYDSAKAKPTVGSDPDAGYLMWNGSPRNDGAGLMAQFQVGS